jgi:D-beta-D-heptose 7-phosphate kinase/D-beta-D-heptose 1-phosphate adenosyltransferase
MKNKRILLIGENCTDIFVYGNCDRLNPEAPTPIIKPKERKENLGMAGNVETNIKHLGLKCDFITNDETILKTRYVDISSNYILLRVDVEPNIVLLDKKIITTNKIKKYDAIVISDYNKGLLTKDFLNNLFTCTKSINIPTFMDTKKDIGDWANDCSFIKINNKEYYNPLHYSFLSTSFFNEKLIVTMGDKGCLFNKEIYPTKCVDVRDVVGAGDTFLSGLVYGYLKNGYIEGGIVTANKLASDVVTKKGVALPNLKLLS